MRFLGMAEHGTYAQPGDYDDVEPALLQHYYGVTAEHI
jgi:hypothetical protein